MKFPLALLVLFIGAFFVPADDKDAAKKDLAKFQGIWVFESIEFEGEKMPVESLKGSKLSVKDNIFTLAQRDEGFLLPDRPPHKGIPKINTTPMTDARRKRLHPKKVQPSKPFKPTVQMVKEIVPNKMIPKFKPL